MTSLTKLKKLNKNFISSKYFVKNVLNSQTSEPMDILNDSDVSTACFHLQFTHQTSQTHLISNNHLIYENGELQENNFPIQVKQQTIKKWMGSL